MRIEIQSLHLDISPRIDAYIREKVEKLHTIYNRIVSATVVLKRQHTSNDQDFFVEIRLEVPRKDIFAQARDESFEAATAEVIAELRTQVEKRKAELLSER